MNTKKNGSIESLIAEAGHVRAIPAAVHKLNEQLTCGNPVLEVRAATTILKVSNLLREAELRKRLEAVEATLRRVPRVTIPLI